MLLVPADTLATPVPFYGKGLGGPLSFLFSWLGFAMVILLHFAVIRADVRDTCHPCLGVVWVGGFVLVLVLVSFLDILF